MFHRMDGKHSQLIRITCIIYLRGVFVTRVSAVPIIVDNPSDIHVMVVLMYDMISLLMYVYVCVALCVLGAVFGLSFLVFFVPICISGIIFFWLRRGIQPIKARQPY